MRHRGLFRTFGVLLLIAGGLWASPAAAKPPVPQEGASGSPRLKYLPKDYWLVTECDLGMIAKVMNSVGGVDNPQMAKVKEYIEQVKQFTAIDLEKDVDYVTLFLAGKPDDPKWLVVAQGSFKNDAVAKRLAMSLKDSLSEKTYKKSKVYTIHTFDLCFPEDSTLAVGEESLVRGALDLAEAKKASLPEDLKQVLQRTPGNTLVWAAVKPGAILDHKGLADLGMGNAEVQKVLRKIDCMSVFFELSDDGLLIKAVGYAAASGGAGSVYKYLSDRKKNLLHEEGTNVVFTSLLILSEIKTNGSFVEGSFRITGTALKELWDTPVIIKPEIRPPQPKDK
jgi:hypothetical protein